MLPVRTAAGENAPHSSSRQQSTAARAHLRLTRDSSGLFLSSSVSPLSPAARSRSAVERGRVTGRLWACHGVSQSAARPRPNNTNNAPCICFSIHAAAAVSHAETEVCVLDCAAQQWCIGWTTSPVTSWSTLYPTRTAHCIPTCTRWQCALTSSSSADWKAVEKRRGKRALKAMQHSVSLRLLVPEYGECLDAAVSQSLSAHCHTGTPRSQCRGLGTAVCQCGNGLTVNAALLEIDALVQTRRQHSTGLSVGRYISHTRWVTTSSLSIATLKRVEHDSDGLHVTGRLHLLLLRIFHPRCHSPTFNLRRRCREHSCTERRPRRRCLPW